MAIQWVAKLSGFRGCQVVSSLSCLMQIYGFYRDLQTTLFHSVAEARFPGGEDDLARGGVTGVPAGDLIIRGVWKCSGMKKSRSLGNGKILIPNLSSACRRRFVRGGLGDSGGKLIFVFRLGFTILLDDMYPESVGDTGSYE